MPQITCIESAIEDSGPDANGRLDPGEMVNLITTLRNFGSAATGVELTLDCADPYITVHAGSAGVGDLGSGATANNAPSPFTVEAAAHTPSGHVADFTLTITYAEGQTTDHFSVCVGRFHYLVWDPSPDRSSGPVIAAALEETGYMGFFGPMLPTDRVDDFSVIFVSCGIYDSNYIIGAGSAEAAALVAYLQGGGNLYLEGGDVWYYDPGIGGFNFNNYFGIYPSSDGSGDLAQVIGLEGTFAEGMQFTYAGENAWIDHIEPAGGNAFMLLRSGTYYGCAVANDTGTYRTIGASFEFAGLLDGASPSTKAALMIAMMGFFMPVDPQAIDPADWVGSGICRISPSYPNPFNHEAAFQYSLAEPAHVQVGLYDPSGRCVKLLADGVQAAGTHAVRFAAHDLSAGVYYLRSRVAGSSAAQKCVVVR